MVFKEAKLKEKQFAVLGLGVFGRSVVRSLFQNGCKVMACDPDAMLVHEASSYATRVVQVDVSDEKELEALGIGNFDVVVVAVTDDFETALIATMVAKERGAAYVLTVAHDLRQKKILESVGADRVVLPEREMGEKVATSLTTSNIIDYINISDEYAIAEIAPAERWVGKTLESARIRAENAINVIAIRRGGSIIVAPRPSEAVLKNDILVVVGENEAIRSTRR